MGNMIPSILFFVLFAQLVPTLAQGSSDVTLPACAETCLSTVLKSSNCSTSQVGCLCSDAALYTGFLTCTQHGCMPKDTLVAVNTTSIVCKAPIRDERPKVIRMASAFFAVTSVIVGLRVYQRLVLGSGLCSDDYLIVVSYLCGIPSTIILIVELAGNGLGRDTWTLSFDNITRFLYFMYINEVLYFTQVFTVKLSILAFYLRLFPGVLIRRLIWGTISVTVSFIIIFDLVTIFQCQPVGHYWTGWDGETEGHCLSINALVWANAASSILLDAWMIFIPLSQLRNLQLHWKKKIGVALMFSVGVFVTAVSILRLQFLVHFGSSANPTWDQFQTSYWSAVELNVSVCCACMPSMRILLERLFPRVLGSTRDRSRLHDSPINLSQHRRAIRIADQDPTAKIIYSREFQVEYATDHEGSATSDREVRRDFNSGWKRDDIP